MRAIEGLLPCGPLHVELSCNRAARCYEACGQCAPEAPIRRGRGSLNFTVNRLLKNATYQAQLQERSKRG